MAKISTKNIANAIYASAKDKKGEELSLALCNAVEFLSKKNMLSKAPEILKHLEQIRNADLNIVEAKVLSETPLAKQTADELEIALKKRYKANDVILQLKEDETLLGGIRIEARDEVIDLSLKHKLNQLQNYLLAN